MSATEVDFYERQAAQQDASTRTLRAQNVLDEVPHLPPDAMGYRHVSDVTLIEFHKTLPLDPELVVHRHAAANYQAVLQCAASSPDGVCVNAELAVLGESYALTSTAPDPSKISD